MSDSPIQKPWISLALAVFFAFAGLSSLLGSDPDPETAVWELAFAVANGMFYWTAKGAPGWVRTTAYAVFFGGLVAALRDLFF